MRTLFNRIHSQSIDMNQGKMEGPRIRKGTVSTLLVPEELAMEMYEDFPTVTLKSGDQVVSVRSGLSMLLNKYRAFFAMGRLPFSEKAKLRYQDEGLNLKEVKFRPIDADWAELGIIAYGLGVSRCWLFSFMLELERLGFDGIYSEKTIRDAVATPAVSRPEQILRISGKRRFLRRILHFRI